MPSLGKAMLSEVKHSKATLSKVMLSKATLSKVIEEEGNSMKQNIAKQHKPKRR
jgi:hypothetical protein